MLMMARRALAGMLLAAAVTAMAARARAGDEVIRLRIGLTCDDVRLLAQLMGPEALERRARAAGAPERNIALAKQCLSQPSR
jgi:hypothetical protein